MNSIPNPYVARTVRMRQKGVRTYLLSARTQKKKKRKEKKSILIVKNLIPTDGYNGLEQCNFLYLDPCKVNS